MKNRIIIFLFFLSAGLAFSQEALKSDVEEYYNFLSLQGLVDRPTLNYRTLSDSVWDIDPETDHPWKNNRLKSTYTLFEKLNVRVYGPELFMSFNTAAPYGQNDGALWQGKGFNTSFTAGVRLEAYGIEATFKPQLAFSQNMYFDIMTTAYPNPYGYFWGYGPNAYGEINGVDAPQRFGDKPFFTYDWGDTEIRYTWKTLTAGFGTQAIWLGPAYMNPILHSNNAPSYPKFDIGLRRQRVVIPYIDWYAGDVEARLWTGLLTESDYYDYNTSNDHNLIHGLTFSYAPSFTPGLTLSVNRTCVVTFELENIKYIIPMDENTTEDQKVSIAASWLFREVGFEVYGELAFDDFLPNNPLIKNPFHSTAFNLGLVKNFNINPSRKIYGQLLFEFNWMEMTQNYQIIGFPTSFYFHYLVPHGYTNRGQWLGNAVSPGGNSQYLGFALYYPKGKSSLFISRNNPDNNYNWKDGISLPPGTADKSKQIKANLLLGIDTLYYLTDSFQLTGGLVYNLILNKDYTYVSVDKVDHNINLHLGVKYEF
jgi:hypothetical protein